jgi:hypothetical protein
MHTHSITSDTLRRGQRSQQLRIILQPNSNTTPFKEGPRDYPLRHLMLRLELPLRVSSSTKKNLETTHIGIDGSGLTTNYRQSESTIELGCQCQNAQCKILQPLWRFLIMYPRSQLICVLDRPKSGRYPAFLLHRVMAYMVYDSISRSFSDYTGARAPKTHGII